MTRPASRARAFVVAVVVLLAFPLAAHLQDVSPQALQAPADPNCSVPQIGALPYDAAGMLVRRGQDLVTATYAHIGPAVADDAKRYAGNNLA